MPKFFSCHGIILLTLAKSILCGGLGGFILIIQSYSIDTNGNPYSVTYYAVSGDPVTDLTEDLAAEAKARAVYEHLMNQTNNPEILGPLSFLRQREIIHFQRFGELLNKYLN